MPDLDLERVREEFEAILEEHADLLERAKGFGFRAAYDRRAALPKGLMPYAEAQKIVEEFEKGPRQIETRLNSLRASVKRILEPYRGNPDNLPSYLHRDWYNSTVLIRELEKTLEKFEVDRKKAQEALDKHEELVVGVHFQEAFEAVRSAILDLKLAADFDLDFEVQTFEASKGGLYSVGHIRFMKGGTQFAGFTVGYRALDDYYWCITGNEKIAGKEGHTFLPKFVREITAKVLARDRAKSWGMFTTRRKVDVSPLPVKKASASWVVRAHTLRRAGASTFEDYYEIADIKAAFRAAVDQALEAGDYNYDSGRRENPGSIATKYRYDIRRDDPLPLKEALEFSRRDYKNSDKWGPAFAIPVQKPVVRSSETVTVLVKAKTEQEALREGSLRIKSTGRIPPKVRLNVKDPKARKVAGSPNTYEVTGEREFIVGKGVTVGWLFYGWAAE